MENPPNFFYKKTHGALRSSLYRSQSIRQQLLKLKIMEFPGSHWVYNDAEDFDTAPPLISGDYTCEIYAQLRPSGRILDHFRAVLAGNRILDVDVDLSAMIPVARFKGWRYRSQYQSRDIIIRRNMLSSSWTDGPGVLAMNDAAIYDNEGKAVAVNDFMAILEDLPEAGPDTFSIRHCVVAGPDRRLALQLQGLPYSAIVLSGKTAFKG